DVLLEEAGVWIYCKLVILADDATEVISLLSDLVLLQVSGPARCTRWLEDGEENVFMVGQSVELAHRCARYHKGCVAINNLTNNAVKGIGQFGGRVGGEVPSASLLCQVFQIAAGAGVI